MIMISASGRACILGQHQIWMQRHYLTGLENLLYAQIGCQLLFLLNVSVSTYSLTLILTFVHQSLKINVWHVKDLHHFPSIFIIFFKLVRRREFRCHETLLRFLTFDYFSTFVTFCFKTEKQLLVSQCLQSRATRQWVSNLHYIRKSFLTP